MASDSIIARPTNKVRLMRSEASGCRAIASSAESIGSPCAKAGPIEPIATVEPRYDHDDDRDNGIENPQDVLLNSSGARTAALK